MIALVRLAREKTISIRLLWPFLRLVSARVPLAPLTPDFVDPDTRLPRSTVDQLLEGALRATGDPALGLEAATMTEPGDLDVLEYAARGCNTLGEAYECMVRYFRLLNEAGALSLQLRGHRAAVVFRIIDGPPAPPAVADYVLMGLIHFARRNAAWDETDVELHLAHAKPSYEARYGEYFDGTVVFDAGQNALVMPLERLSTPMQHANAPLAQAFQQRAQDLIARLAVHESTASLVRSFVTQHLGSGKVSMSFVAEELGMSVPTLRRHLEAEGTSFKVIVEDVRHQIAEQELARRDTSVSELAFALGFSNISAFDRAFKRWTGLSPTAFRERALAGAVTALVGRRRDDSGTN